MQNTLTQQFLSLPINEKKEILDNVLRTKKMLHNEMDEVIVQSSFHHSSDIKTKRGFLIQAPCGSGKSTWISHRSDDEQNIWLDGDVILEEEGVKNKNYFWYDRRYSKEREAIIATFDKYLAKGCNILYSGNPMLIKTDLMILPPAQDRWQRLQEREKTGGWCPLIQQFNREEKTYHLARKTIPHIITPAHCPIPSPEYMTKFINKLV